MINLVEFTNQYTFLSIVLVGMLLDCHLSPIQYQELPFTIHFCMVFLNCALNPQIELWIVSLEIGLVKIGNLKASLQLQMTKNSKSSNRKHFDLKKL